ncbi:MAG: 4Fe-4S dicluster domain-containing protein [Candidatus Cloacimonetes bacterium]|nr:4Fe-4S dicluster domain-containing protein [Candidatus Cloacimonadota bacterium]
MDKIILKEMDANFKNEIAAQPGAEHFKRCFTCGTCTAACPVAEVNEDYDPRKIIRMALLGMKEEVLSSDILWMCSRCYTCYALCPQGVKFTDVIEVLREMAIRQGYVPKDRIQKIRKLDKFVQKLRCDLITNKLHPENDDSDAVCKTVKDELSQVW